MIFVESLDDLVFPAADDCIEACTWKNVVESIL